MSSSTSSPSSKLSASTPARSSLESLFKKFKNPVYGTSRRLADDGPRQQDFESSLPSNASGIMDALIGRQDSSSSSIPSSLVDVKVSERHLRNSRVIAQLLEKYILCVSETSDPDGQSRFLLLAFDQHAVDERIRLDELEKEVLPPPGARCDIPPRFSNKQRVRLVWRLIGFDVRMIEGHRGRLRAWGFEIGYVREAFSPTVHSTTTAAVSESTELAAPVDIQVLQVPVLCGTALNEERYLRDLLLFFNDRRFAGATRVPLSWLQVLHSRSCRSAIMFGDSLTREQCQQLIDRLAQCDFPFNCAHGRPNVYPLLLF